MSMLWIAEL